MCRRLLALLFVLLLGPSTGQAEPPSSGKPVAVIFVPLTVDHPFARQERLLRDVLSARMIATGRFVETVTAETERHVQRCVKEVNRDVNAETCWVRIGQGQGAEAMVSGEIRGTEDTCSVTLRLTVLETRVTERKHVETLGSCRARELKDEVERAARLLAGERPPAPGPAGRWGREGAVAPSTQENLPPPAVAVGRPNIRTGSVTASVGQLLVEAKPTGRVRLEITNPLDEKVISGSPYENRMAAVGKWALLARADGYGDERRSFAVPADEITLVKIELKRLGSLDVTGSPAGAAVTVSGPEGFSHAGGLPWSAENLVAGAYRVQVSRPGYRTFTEMAQVAPGETARLEAALQKVLQEPLTAPAVAERGSHGIEWISLPGGTFAMGSSTGDDQERPVHAVRVLPFRIMKTEVTVAMWRECVRSGVCKKPTTLFGLCNWNDEDKEQHPVNCLSWDLAHAFARWVGDGARLCSEAEWEYAARSGGAAQPYPWGDAAPDCTRAVLSQDESGCGKQGTWPVCSRPTGSSAQGVCDLAGNVREWVQDGYHADYQGAPTSGRAWGSPHGHLVGVVRGGGWESDGQALRTTAREDLIPTRQPGDAGARMCRD